MNLPSEFHSVEIENHLLPYQEFGNGEQLLFAFHGFGGSSADFKPLAEVLAADYTIIAFDFFYHGVNWPSDDYAPISNGLLASLAERILWERKKVKASVIGYSQGASFALSLIQRMPHRLDQIFLLAADGFRPNYLQHFCTRTRLGQMIANRTFKKPTFALQLIELLSTIKIIPKENARFFQSQLKDEKKRHRVWKTWIVLRDFQLNINLIAHYVRSKKLRVHLLYGKRDRITPAKHSNRFLKLTKGYSKLHWLEAGHDLKNYTKDIAQIMQRVP